MTRLPENGLSKSGNAEKQKSQMHEVIWVEPLSDYRIKVTFSEGVVGEIDMSDDIGKGGVFAPLADPTEFAKVHVDSKLHCVTWPGEIDLCPVSMYKDITDKGSLHRLTGRTEHGRL